MASWRSISGVEVRKKKKKEGKEDFNLEAVEAFKVDIYEEAFMLTKRCCFHAEGRRGETTTSSAKDSRKSTLLQQKSCFKNSRKD